MGVRLNAVEAKEKRGGYVFLSEKVDDFVDNEWQGIYLQCSMSIK